MLKKPASKYTAFAPIQLEGRQWPGRTITKAPIWMSSDLRDGNQALFEPMNAERKMRSILAVQAIAKAEQITVSNAEVDAEYVRLSKLHDTPEEEIRKVLSRDAIAAAVTNQKVQRFLLDHAALTSVVEKE